MTTQPHHNLWAFTIIFCGHFPDGTHEFTEERAENETRGEWYHRRSLGSANLRRFVAYLDEAALSLCIEALSGEDLLRVALPAAPGKRATSRCPVCSAASRCRARPRMRSHTVP